MESVKQTVSVGIALTVNLGDYNSVKIDMRTDNVQIQDGENTSQALDRVYALLDRKIEEKSQKIIKEFNG